MSYKCHLFFDKFLIIRLNVIIYPEKALIDRKLTFKSYVKKYADKCKKFCRDLKIT